MKPIGKLETEQSRNSNLYNMDSKNIGFMPSGGMEDCWKH